MNPREKTLYAVAHAADQRAENAPTDSARRKAHAQARAAYIAISFYHREEAREAKTRADHARDMAEQHNHRANA